MRRAVLLCGALLVSACATRPEILQVWIRTDGQRVQGAPILEQQFEVDRLACLGDVQKTNVVGGPTYCQGLAGCMVAGAARGSANNTIMLGCMADRGYLLVPENEADARRAAIRSAAPPAATSPQRSR